MSDLEGVLYLAHETSQNIFVASVVITQMTQSRNEYKYRLSIKYLILAGLFTSHRRRAINFSLF